MASESTHSEGAELGRYLRARRTQTSPDQVGLTVGAGIRRTPGLRREELATLAGISIDYYVRLERGKETRPSPALLDALARALHMDGQQHQHLRELAARAAPDVPDLTNLVGELLLKSPDFAGLWERYEVTGRKPAHKTFQHPQVGTVTLTSQSLHVEAPPASASASTQPSLAAPTTTPCSCST